jgi:hypothetical protein
MRERDGVGNCRKRPPSFVYRFSRLAGGAAQALQIANHIVQPRLGAVEQPMAPRREKQERETRADCGAYEHFGKLCVSVHEISFATEHASPKCRTGS